MVDLLTILAWLVFATLLLALVAVIVYLGSLPGKIALKRNHPQADAINAASWIGLALGGVGWPIAFVWAFVRQAPLGAEVGSDIELEKSVDASSSGEMAELAQRVAAVEQRISSMEQMNKG